MEMWSEELSPEQAEQMIEKAAQEIHRRRLGTPATLALEMHKPLAGIAGSAAVVFAPFIVPFLGFDSVNDYSRLFSNREHIERLLDRIESLEAGDDASRRTDA